MNEPDNNGEESFEKLFEEKGVERQRLEPGQKIQATVTGLAKEYAFLDTGGKGEGYIAISEFTDSEGNITVQTGDQVEAYFLSAANHEMLFTTRLGAGAASMAHLEEAFANRIPVEGLVKGEIKGGFEITVSDTRCFCPFSQIDLRRADDTEAYIGQRLDFRIIEYKENGRNIILSRRVLLEEAREEQKQALQETLTEGMTVKGTITSIRDFGAFMDIGGMDGLIPISEIAWGKTDSVHDELAVGQEVEAVVLKIDWDLDRVSLSLKNTLPDPWDSQVANFPVGSSHTGTVARLMKFGAFVTLAPGIDGLIHISKLGAGRRLNHPGEVVQEGQKLEVCIEQIDHENKRISLKIVSEEANEAEETDAEDLKKYSGKSAAKANKPMGTLGDLLKSQMAKKKK